MSNTLRKNEGRVSWGKCGTVWKDSLGAQMCEEQVISSSGHSLICFPQRQENVGSKKAQRNVTNSFLMPYTKIHARRIVIINMKVKTIKLLEGNAS